MPSARHFTRSQPADETRAEIERDIKMRRTAQRDLQAVGQHQLAERMRDATDEALDELNDLDNGTWKPDHA